MWLCFFVHWFTQLHQMSSCHYLSFLPSLLVNSWIVVILSIFAEVWSSCLSWPCNPAANTHGRPQSDMPPKIIIINTFADSLRVAHMPQMICCKHHIQAISIFYSTVNFRLTANSPPLKHNGKICSICFIPHR